MYVEVKASRSHVSSGRAYGVWGKGSGLGLGPRARGSGFWSGPYRYDAPA